MNDIGWGQFTRMLEYKTLWKGKYLVKISKYFPSSKLCSVCSYKNKGLTMSERTWVCPRCGTEHNRDVNAANNIREEGIRIFSHSIQSTVGTTETDHTLMGEVYACGDCVRPVHGRDLAISEALSCTGNGQ